MNGGKKLFIGLNYVGDRYMDRALDAMQVKNHSRTGSMRNSLRTLLIAAVIVSILLALSAVAYAMGHIWSRGMRDRLDATEEQQQTMADKGMAKVFTEDEKNDSMAVTSNGVTVKPLELVADENTALVSFAIDGFSLKEGEEPGFENIIVYMGNDPGSRALNMSGSFSYEQERDGNGNFIGTPQFADESGRLEFVMTLSPSNHDDTLLGREIHVRFVNLCADTEKAAKTPVLNGEWDFDIKLPEKSSVREIRIGKSVEGTAFTMESAKITPLSIEIAYSVSGRVSMAGDDLAIPMFRGFVLKDGTRLFNIANGGSSGYTDDSMTAAFSGSVLDRVIDPDEVAEIIVSRSMDNSKDIAGIPLS